MFARICRLPPFMAASRSQTPVSARCMVSPDRWGDMVDAPHGDLCAALLSAVMTGNVAALMERAPGGPALSRYGEIARILTGDPMATIDDGLAWIETLCGDLEIRRLSDRGLTEDDLPLLIRNAAKASSMQANPIRLTEVEMERIIRQAL